MKYHQVSRNLVRKADLFFLKALLCLELRIIRVNQDDLLTTANLFNVTALFPSLQRA